MADIVKMLRERADRAGRRVIDYTDDCTLDYLAADEIERLREALRKVACTDESCACMHLYGDPYEKGCAFGIARAALGEDK
jgi:hypothetical protein